MNSLGKMGNRLELLGVSQPSNREAFKDDGSIILQWWLNVADISEDLLFGLFRTQVDQYPEKATCGGLGRSATRCVEEFLEKLEIS